jgi:hypothetical protein
LPVGYARICGDVIRIGNFWREVPEIAEGGSRCRASGVRCAQGPPVSPHWDYASRTTDGRLRQGPRVTRRPTPSGLLQVRPGGAGDPVRMRPQTRVDRLLSLPQRVDVGVIGVRRCGQPPLGHRQRRRGRGPGHRHTRWPHPVGRAPPRRLPPERLGKGRRAGSGHRRADRG